MPAEDLAERSGRIRQEATEWLVRMDGDASADVIAAFNEWRARDPEHGEAFLQAMKAWSGSGALHRITQSNPERVPAEFRQLLQMAGTVRRSSPAFRWPAVLAAAAVLAALGLAALVVLGREPGAAVYRTATGDQATIAQRDGGRVIINTDSELRVEDTAIRRVIHLDRGEARFATGGRPGVPLIVEAGRMRIEAAAAVFNVYIQPRETELIVLDGTVRLSAPGGGSLRGTPPGGLDVGRGQRITLGDALGEPQRADAMQVQRATVWTEGSLRFDDWPLEAVVAEVNRYRTEKVDIGDETLRSLRVTRAFGLTQLDSFVRTLESEYGVRAQRLAPDRVVIYAGG